MSVEAIELQPGADTPAIETPEQVVVEVPAPVAPVELRYEYQPTDESGRPIGGKQVIKYTTPEELAGKLTEQNTLLVRKLREATRKNRLGILDDEQVPDEAQRFEEPVDFKPRTLSAEERIQLSRDILDPERFDEATDTLFEAKMGAKPKVLTDTIAELQQDRINERARIEVEAFKAANSDYVVCKENSDAITGWMLRKNLAPTRQNFQRAYEALKNIDPPVLVLTYSNVEPEPEPVVEPVPEPVQVDEPAPEPVVEVPVAVAPVEEPVSVPRIPTGLNRNNSEEIGPVRSAVNPDEITYIVEVNGQKRKYTGLAAINAMPADEYKRRLMSDPNFAKKEQALEKEAAERRRAKSR